MFVREDLWHYIAVAILTLLIVGPFSYYQSLGPRDIHEHMFQAYGPCGKPVGCIDISPNNEHMPDWEEWNRDNMDRGFIVPKRNRSI